MFFELQTATTAQKKIFRKVVFAPCTNNARYHDLVNDLPPAMLKSFNLRAKPVRDEAFT